MKTILYIIGFLLFLAGMIALYAWGDIAVSFSESKVKNQLQDFLPVIRGEDGKTASLTAIDVDFQESGSALVEADYIILYEGRSLEGKLAAVGKPVYSSGNIYIRELDVKDMEVINLKVDQTDRDITREMKNAILEQFGIDNNVANDWLRANKDIVEKVALSFVSGIVTNFLKDIPVYSLTEQDMKQSVAAWFITDVQISDDTVTVIISPFTLLMRIVLYIVLGIISIVGAFALVMALGTRQ